MLVNKIVVQHFNPLSPHGERRLTSGKIIRPPIFQSTLPAWGETMRFLATDEEKKISIHSPRMGRDMAASDAVHQRAYFNPLSPHGERLLDAV